MNPMLLLIDCVGALAGGALVLGSLAFWILLQGRTDGDIRGGAHEKFP